jgi:hypothetical protein
MKRSWWLIVVAVLLFSHQGRTAEAPEVQATKEAKLGCSSSIAVDMGTAGTLPRSCSRTQSPATPGARQSPQCAARWARSSFGGQICEVHDHATRCT